MTTPTCLDCGVYTIADGDRYCGHCAAPLARLKFDNGGQITLPPDVKGRLELSLRCRNDGLSRVDLNVDAPTDPAVTYRGKTALQFRPFDQPGLFQFEVNADLLQQRPNKRIEIPFTSTACGLKSGRIRIAVQEKGKVIATLATPDLGKVYAEQVIDLMLHFENAGNMPCTVELQPMASNSIVEICSEGKAEPQEMLLNAGEDKDLTLPVRMRGEPQQFTESLKFTVTFRLDSKDDILSTETVNVTLKGKIEAVPEPAVEPEIVDFETVVPGLVVIRSASIKERQSGQFELVSPHGSGSRLVRLLPKRYPIEVGPKGTQIDLAFSTRWDTTAWKPGQPDPRGHVAFETNIPSVDLSKCPTWPWAENCTHKGRPRRLNIPWKASVSPTKPPSGIFAVDFGTVNSCVAYYDGKTLEVIKDTYQTESAGDPGVIPSMMTFVEENLFVIGQRADELARDYAGRYPVVQSIKRCLLGDDRIIFGKTYSPIQLAAMMIEQLLLEAERRCNHGPERVVMTVPANFTGAARAAMVEACRSALGGKLGDNDVMVIDEPTAAAMYYVYTGPPELQELTETHRILVFDFGGGTLDVCIVEISPMPGGGREIRPVVARGDNFMGGIDIDITLLRAMAEKAQVQYKKFYSQAITCDRAKYERSKSRSWDDWFLGSRIKWHAESKRCKEDLSKNLGSERTSEQQQYPKSMNPSTPKATGSGGASEPYDSPDLLNKTGKPLDVRFSKKVTEKEFEEIIEERVTRAVELVKSTIKAAGLCEKDVHTVLFAGQSSQIPAFRERVQGLFESSTVIRDKKDELKTSVAMGAAVASHWKAQAVGGDFSVRNLERTSYRYGYLTQVPPKRQFHEMIGIGTDFLHAESTIRLKGRNLPDQIVICQNATCRKGNDENGNDIYDQSAPALTELGILKKESILKALNIGNEEEFDFTLRFPCENGELQVLANGRPIPWKPNENNREGFVYL